MAIYSIVQNGDDILRAKAVTVKRFGENLHNILDNMAETLDDANGLGLAAPQIGISKKIAIVKVDDEYIELINPQIINTNGKEIKIEGCLSCPDISGYVERAQKITVKAQDRHGNEKEWQVEDLMARAMQHEIDHLEGILFIDLMIRPAD